MEAIFIAWLTGINSQLYQVQLWPTLAYVIIFLLSIFSLFGLGWLHRVRGSSHPPFFLAWGRRMGIWVLLACMGFAWAGCLASYKVSQALAPQLEQQNVIVKGSIAALPQLQSGRWRFVFQVDEATLDGKPVRFPPQLMLSWYFSSSDQDNRPELRVGQHWSFQVRVKAPHGSMNPHTFDYELWLWGQGIGAVGYVRTAKDSPIPELLSDERVYTSMEQWRESTRIQIRQTVKDPRQAGLIAALTLGDQRAIEQSDWDTFRITGIAHLVSISGLHITMMAWLAYGLVYCLWRRSTRLMLRVPAHMAALVVGLGCACLYAWFAGWGVPAQRTVLMLATVVALRFVGIRWPWYVVWLFVACVVITIDPWAFLQAGFWLSFVAVGVLFAQSPVKIKKEPQQPSLLPITPQSWWQKGLLSLWEEIRQLLVIQARISIALAPLTLLLFQQVSVVGLLANLFAIPWVTFVMVPLAMLGILFHPLWYLAAWAGRVLIVVLEWFASWPLSVLDGAAPPLAIAVLAVVGAVALVLPSLKWGYRLLGALAVFPIFFWQPARPEQGEFEALFLDVGQGSAVLVRTAHHALVYDVGPKYGRESDAGAVLVVPTLRAMGVKLDRIVVSHIDSDHAGGLNSVWLAHPQADLLLSAPVNHPLWQVPPTQTRQKIACTARAQWQWDGVHFEVLHPFADDVKSFDAHIPSNAQSCVLRITSHAGEGQKERSILLTGDIEIAQELELVKKSQAHLLRLSADVLLMPHHGSKTSSSQEFLASVSPTWAVAQAGYLNRYGHPAQAVVDRYSAQQTQVVNTASCGAALWRSHQAQEIQCERQKRARYWQHQNIRATF